MQAFLAQFKLRPMMAFHLEQFILRNADRIVQGYTGGMWDDALVKKAKITLIPGKDDEQVTIHNIMGGGSITTDRLTASAAFVCCVVNWFWNMYTDKMTDKENAAMSKFYHALRDNVYGKNSGVNTDDYFSFTD